MTFLETILAVVLLGMTASTLSLAIGSMQRTQLRHTKQLGANELANRLMLQYLDDRESMPNETLPLEYGQHLYRWSMDLASVQAKVDPAAGDEKRSIEQALGRLVQVSFRVWLGEDSGGSYRFDPTRPHATLTRLDDPLLPSNPHALEKLLADPQRVMQLIQGLQNIQQGRDVDPDIGGDVGSTP